MDSLTVIRMLGMKPHPEGGRYVETWRAASSGDGTRPPGSAILYLLAEGERSHWHRVDAAEVWQWSGGTALELRTWAPGEAVTTIRLGGDLAGGDRPQAVVPAHAWQTARPLGAWALVGCIVAPAFEFSGFELAPVDWEPPVT